LVDDDVSSMRLLDMIGLKTDNLLPSLSAILVFERPNSFELKKMSRQV
jgi:hypothetical protein